MKYEIDEEIIVVPYQKIWPRLFRVEKNKIKKIFRDKAVQIEHFGSTSIFGMSAKPVVDILVGVKQLSAIRRELIALKREGYEYLGEAGVPGRLALRKRGKESYNLAVVLWSGEVWKNNLVIRDYLRVHPIERKKYSEHKEKVMKMNGTLLAYSRAKQKFMADLLQKAKEWKG